MKARAPFALALGVLGAMTFGSGCATPFAGRERGPRLGPTGCAPRFEKMLFLPALALGDDGEGEATTMLTAIPAVPACIAGALAAAPIALLTLHGEPLLVGALIGDAIATPVIFPF